MIPVDHPEKVRAVLVAHAGWMPVADSTFMVSRSDTGGRYGDAVYVYWQDRGTLVGVYVDPAAVLGVAYGDVGQ